MEIKEPYTPEEFKEYFKTRWEILRKPWGSEEGSEIDDNENISLHAMAQIDGEIAGVGRLTYYPTGEGQIRFMGVQEKFRQQGVGQAILAYLEDEARKMGLKKIYLNARDNALIFYSKLGYEAEGKPFIGFADIGHTKMIKQL